MDEARRILNQSSFPITAENDFEKAAEKVVSLVKNAKWVCLFFFFSQVDGYFSFTLLYRMFVDVPFLLLLYILYINNIK